MKRLFRYIAALTLLISFTSCVEESIDMPNRPVDPGNGIRISGVAVPFDSKVVNTRADGDQPDDLFISGMTLFVFDSNGDLIPGYRSRPSQSNPRPLPTSAITIKRPNPTFLIDKSTWEGTQDGIFASLDGESSRTYYFDTSQDALRACEIYVVANLWHVFEGEDGANEELEKIQSKTDLLNYVINIDNTLAMPKHPTTGEYYGFPMIGTVAPQADGNATTFNLKAGEGIDNAVATIPMKKLFSKIDFRLSVKANQVIENGDMPKFQIDRVEVFNIPTLALMSAGEPKEGILEPGKTNPTKDKWIQGYADGSDYQTNERIAAKGVPLYQFMDPSSEADCNGSFEITTFNRRTTQHDVSNNPPYIEFGFYMPEHYVDPIYKTVSLPNENMTEAERLAYLQQMKPLYMRGNNVDADGVRTYNEKQKATFIRLHGKYTDHHGQIFTVAYDVYLGHNNSDDFNVERNCQLTNYLTINGITNHNQAGEGTISLDHRVDVEDAGYLIAQEREAILDAHFEVRPVDITLSGGSSMTITIPADAAKWISMESDAAAKGRQDICSNLDKGRVRKFFTTGLIGELNGNLIDGPGGVETLKITNPDANKSNTYRVWFYIDENPNVYDPKGKGKQTAYETGDYTVDSEQFRHTSVKFAYMRGETILKENEIKFQQHNLWRVWNTDETRFYDIEVEEEYLNNYAADDEYGETQNGMPWGLEGVKLSRHYKATYMENATGGILPSIIEYFGSYDAWLNNIIDNSGLTPYYDFYLSRDNPLQNSTIRDYSGYIMSTEILATLDSLYTVSNKEEKYKVDGIVLTEPPLSAFAYCMHKNKRNKDGSIAAVNWYMPSIDEIEEIAIAAYDQFDGVFQNNLYWSCQPAFFNKVLQLDREANYILWKYDERQRGNYMDDDPNRARATKVVYDPSDPKANEEGYANVSSAVNGIEGTYILQITSLWEGSSFAPEGGDTGGDNLGTGYYANKGNGAPNVEINYNDYYRYTTNLFDQTNYTNPDHDGNVPRSQLCRIRTVYRSSENIKNGLQ